MVDLPTLQRMKQHYRSNVRRYLDEGHEGEYILLENSKLEDHRQGFQESFFLTEEECDAKIKKNYGDNIGYTVFTKKIIAGPIDKKIGNMRWLRGFR